MRYRQRLPMESSLAAQLHTLAARHRQSDVKRNKINLQDKPHLDTSQCRRVSGFDQCKVIGMHAPNRWSGCDVAVRIDFRT